MASDESPTWTTMTVSEETLSQINDFVDVYDIQSNDKAVSLLTRIVSNSSLTPDEIVDMDAVTVAGEENTISITGFLVTNDTGDTTYVGADDTVGAVLTDTSQPKSSVQPLPRTNITSGTVICPACGDTLVDYALSDSLPGIKTGVFNTFTIRCDTCDSQRPLYTLFTASDGTTPPVSALADVMKSYFAYVFILDSYPPEEFTNRISACRTLSEDAGWEWLPHPDDWVGFDIGVETYPTVTQEMYIDFIRTYLSQTVSSVDGVSIVGTNISSSSLNDGSGGVSWDITIETRGDEISDIVNQFSNVFDTWDGQDVVVDLFDPDSLADHAATLRFPRFLVDS